MENELLRNFMLMASGLGALTGLGLLLFPDTMSKLSRVGSTWISLRRATRFLEKPVNTDEWMIRHRIPVGLLMVSAGVYLGARLVF